MDHITNMNMKFLNMAFIMSMNFTKIVKFLKGTVYSVM